MPQVDMYQSDILIVDDTPSNLNVLARMLTKRDYRVRVATDGPMALDSVQRTPPDLNPARHHDASHEWV